MLNSRVCLMSTEASPPPGRFDRRLGPLLALLVLFVLLAVVGQKLGRSGNFAYVTVETSPTLKIAFLRYGLLSEADCAQAGQSVAALMTANCPMCKVSLVQCLARVSEEQRTLLFTDRPVAHPTGRFPNGVVSYLSPDLADAAAACELSERGSADSRGVAQVRCFPPQTARPLPAGMQRSSAATETTFRALLYFVLAVVLGLAGYHALRRRASHGRTTPGIEACVEQGGTRPPFDLLPAKLTLAGTDLAVLLGTLLAVAWPQSIAAGGAKQFDLTALLTHVSVVAALIGWFWVFGEHYARRRPFWDELQEQLRLIAMMFFVFGAIVFALKLEASRVVYLWVWILNLLLLPLGRAAARGLLDVLGRWRMPTVIVGAGRNAREAVAALRSATSMGYEVVALIDAVPDAGADVRILRAPGEVPQVMIPAARLRDTLLRLGSPQVVVALDSLNDQESQRLIRQLTTAGRNLHVIPSIRGLPLFGTRLSHFFSHDVLFLTVRNNLSRRSYRWLKRGFDVLASSLLLLLLAPVLLLVAFLVRRDGGAAIYGHRRIGYGGKAFQCLKFRTMRIDADQVLEDILRRDEVSRAQWEKDFKLKNDPRITAVGRFLRRTSLDELPQLINVVRGEMSLVGPRPIVQAELDRYGDQAGLYLQVSPGITGLWQVSGRNDTSYAERVALDAWYVQNWSLWYDIAILFSTVRVVLGRKGAY